MDLSAEILGELAASALPKRPDERLESMASALIIQHSQSPPHITATTAATAALPPSRLSDEAEQQVDDAKDEGRGESK